MRRNKRDFGRLILIAIFLFVAVLLPNLINAISRAAGTLGTFAAGETGIKLCAVINNGLESSLRFNVTNNQGFQADVVVDHNTCKNIETVAATYTIRQYLPQEYTLTSVTGGTVSADNTAFITTTSGQYSVIYTNDFEQKPYLHNFGYTTSKTNASAVEVTFDANGGTGTMSAQSFGLNVQQALTANAFSRAGYDFDSWNTKADGTGESYANQQQLTFATGGELTLYVKWAPTNRVADIPIREISTSYNVDFTRKAVISDDSYTENGNGVRDYTENGETIRYYRGEVSNNNIIWANKCWKMLRTTYTGGTKLIYNGLPNASEQCLSTGTDVQITYNNENTFKFNTYSIADTNISPADEGYMNGYRNYTRVEHLNVDSENDVFIFSNKVSYDEQTYTYTLDTSSGQSISGTWGTKREQAASRYHYFCENGATSCEYYQLGYIHYFGDTNTIHYISIKSFSDYEDAKTGIKENRENSNAKKVIEGWFEAENLDGHIADTKNYEDELEDAIFCNDRGNYSGALKGENSNGYGVLNYYNVVGRIFTKNASNNYEPSLDCADQNDAFTKEDIVNGNGALGHKIGLVTADELRMAGIVEDTTANNYLYANQQQQWWTMTPYRFYSSDQGASVVGWGNDDASQSSNLDSFLVSDSRGFRPVVSLKSTATILMNGADGTATNPYIVE